MLSFKYDTLGPIKVLIPDFSRNFSVKKTIPINVLLLLGTISAAVSHEKQVLPAFGATTIVG